MLAAIVSTTVSISFLVATHALAASLVRRRSASSFKLNLWLWVRVSVQVKVVLVLLVYSYAFRCQAQSSCTVIITSAISACPASNRFLIAKPSIWIRLISSSA